jgi:hypothetical protein
MTSGLVVFPTFGSLAGIVLAGPSVYFAMDRGTLLAFAIVARVSPLESAPGPGLVLIGPPVYVIRAPSPSGAA